MTNGSTFNGATRLLLRAGLLLLTPILGFSITPFSSAQPANTSQKLDLAGLRSAASQGQFNAVSVDASGNIFLLLDQQDGVRILKADSSASSVLAQAQLGAAGDSGTALALDPAGNVYVTGTTTSGSLNATTGAAIPSRTGTSTNSFVAKFDSSLNPLFVTFTGGSRIAAAAIAATPSAVFVTGITYGTDLPVTSNAVQPAFAAGSTQNGFVEKFSSNGTALLYATYLSGANGDTTPTAITAIPSGDTFIAGSTTAPGFPTVAALVPAILSSPSGFLTRLSSAGDTIVASTFVPGPGLTSLAPDSSGSSLLASGSIALGQFPVSNAAAPLAQTNYQVLLRLPFDLSTVSSGTVLAPGNQSFVSAAPAGGAWVDGNLTLPILPLTPLSDVGSGFALRVSSADVIDQTARFGGLPIGNFSFASLPFNLTSIAIDSAGKALVAGGVQPTSGASLLATQTYDLPLRNTPSPLLPSTLRSTVPPASGCSTGQCSGSAAFLARLDPAASAAALAFSANSTPFLTLRNLGTTPADGLQFTASSGTFTSSCPASLNPGGECSVLLSGGAGGTLTATSSDADPQSVTYPAYSATPPPSTIVFSPRELDFGIQTATSPASTRTITVTNLGTASQTFASQLDAFSNNKIVPSSPFSESSSDCVSSGSQTSKLLSPGGTCHITIAFAPTPTAASDGIVQAQWLIGTQDVPLTGFSQAAALSVSASEIDFGTQYSNGIHLPRFLFLSNSSASSVAHAALALPSGSPFAITDGCPATLLPTSICRIRIDYAAATSTSSDSTTLTLDQGISVLLTGNTLPPPAGGGTTVGPSLSVTPTTVAFPDSVVVTGVSASTQTVAITNTGAASFPLTLSVTGDFNYVTSCTATLAAGQTCAIALSFAPTQAGVRTGLLSVTAGAGTTPTYVALSGTGTPVLATVNGSIAFGATPVGQPVTQAFKVAQPFTSLTATTTGPYSIALVEDTGSGPGQPPTSAFSTTITQACHNCYLVLRFQPTLTGAQSGALTLSSSPAGSPLSISLSGTGLPLTGLLLTPLSQDFGSVPVHGRSSTMLFTLTNLASSGASVNVTQQLLGSDFVVDSTSTSGTACGGPLAYTASCTAGVAFAPATAGARTGSLLFTAGELSAIAALTGNATADSALALSPQSLTFSSASGVAATTQTVTLTNTGSASLQIGTLSIGSSSFTAASSCAALAPNASCNITVTFQPGTSPAQAALSIPVTAAGNTQPVTYSVALNGTYTLSTAGLQFSPGTTQFGPSPVATETAARLLNLTNLTAKTLTVSITLPRQYVLVGDPCTALAASASCTVSVAFLPLTNGDIPGTITATAIPADGSPSLTALAYLEGYGNGAGTLTLSGALIVNGAFNFGQVALGQSLAQTFTLTNSQPAGSSALTIRRITSAPPFLASTTCSGAIPAGQTCTVTLTYSPASQSSSTSISDAGQLTIESDAASSPTVLNLSGTPGPGGAGTPPLATYTLSQNSLTFASTQVGNISPAQAVTISNTGSIPLHIASISATTDFTVQNTCTTILPAATCTFTVTSTPQNSNPPTGLHIASLEIASDSATSLEFISLLSSAAPATLTISPLSLNFGSVQVGGNASLPVTVLNSGSNPVTFTSLAATTDYAAAGSCPASGSTLPAGASCTVQVTYTPTLAGTRNGSLSIATSATTLPLTVSLTGVGTQSQLVIAPSALAFGSITIGASSNISLTLKNNGTAPVTNLALAIAGDYALTIPCPATTLAPGASCTAQVTFMPTAAGARPATLTVTSSDPSSPAAIPLTGTGVAAAGSFTLSVAGASSSTISVAGGTPAAYTLTITPVGGFTGTVVLTCAPVTAAPYATCSLAPGSVTLAGSAQTAVATITTITSAANQIPALSSNLSTPLLCVVFPGVLLLWRGRREPALKHLPRRLPLLLALAAATAATALSLGCGGGSPASNVRYSPVGTYQYQVTAVSTGGVQVTQTVTLNLVVGPH